MTKSQRTQYKRANQERKLAMLKRNRKPVREGHIVTIQDGKHTRKS